MCYAVTSTAPFQSGIGQVDDIAVWSRALGPPEVLRVFTEGIRESDSDLSLFYNFNEGTGGYAQNKGRAGAQYDLVLGRSEVGGPTAYHVANKFGGTDQITFTQPVWALSALAASAPSFVPRCRPMRPAASVAKLQPTGYGGKPFVTLKESASIHFILEYFHPRGMKSTVRISRPPMHGTLEQVICAGAVCNRTLVLSAPFQMSSSAYAFLVRSCDIAIRVRSSRSAMSPRTWWWKRLFDRSIHPKSASRVAMSYFTRSPTAKKHRNP
jgi:hypothetical protein